MFRVALGAGLVFLATGAGVVFEYFHSPYWTRVGWAPDQPVLFSHRHHAGELRIDCRFCHATVETSAFAGMPATQTCLACHSQIFTDTAMLHPVMRSAATGDPLRWSRVTHLPDHVFFDHSIHLAKGVACVTCHGELGRMALTAKARQLDMRWCLDCHRNPGAHLQSGGDLFAALQPTGSDRGSPPGVVPADPIHAGHLMNCSTCHH